MVRNIFKSIVIGVLLVSTTSIANFDEQDYSQLETSIKQALAAKNLKDFDQEYKNDDKRIPIQVTRFILKELFAKNFTFGDAKFEVEPSRITLISRIVDDVKKAYPNTQEIINYVSLGSGSMNLDYLILLGLASQGYSKFSVFGIDITYDDGTESRELDNFKKQAKGDGFSIVDKIPAATTKENNKFIALFGIKNVYEYIAKVLATKLPRPHIFTMIQPSNMGAMYFYDTSDTEQEKQEKLSAAFTEQILDRSLPLTGFSVDVANKYVKFYLPYNKQDIFAFSTLDDQTNSKLKHLMRDFVQELGARDGDYRLTKSKDGQFLVQEFVYKVLELISQETKTTRLYLYPATDIHMAFNELIRLTHIPDATLIAYINSWGTTKQFTRSSDAFKSLEISERQDEDAKLLKIS